MSNSCASASLGYKENSYEDKELLPFRGNDKEIVSKKDTRIPSSCFGTGNCNHRGHGRKKFPFLPLSSVMIRGPASLP